MTSRQGKVWASYDQIVEVFGLPRRDIPRDVGDGTTEWWVNLKGRVVSIYDTCTVCVPSWYWWHIGGDGKVDVGLVVEALQARYPDETFEVSS